MTTKKWLKLFFISFVLVSTFISFVNYYIDPLWNFNHSNDFNNIQDDFDERQQKTNYIKTHGLSEFDGILLGSSRASFINQNDFYDMNIYNYSVNSMMPQEYKSYIDFAKEEKKKEFKYIILGLDFFGTNANHKIKFKESSFYIHNAQSIFYKIKMLLSYGVLKKSISSFNNYLNKERIEKYYDRNNIKYQKKVSEEDRIRKYTKNLKRHTLEFQGKNYIYNKKFLTILNELKETNSNTKFIIYTSPITADLLISILNNADKMEEFERWLKDIIEIFGEVNHFMTINSITINLNNYPDDDHAYPYIMKLLANKLSYKKNYKIPHDFGIILNKNNIDEFLNIFASDIKKYNTLIF